MPDVGDAVTAQLVVAPYDSSTVATLAVTAPDGTVSNPVATSTDGGQTWTAPLTYTAAGIWLLRWMVIGTGASVETQRVGVAPAPAAMADVRSYATTTQLANFLHAAPPLDAVKLLERATTLLDSDFLKAAVYDVDADGMPADPVVAKAFAEAVCAQVEFWGEVGEETDISGPVKDVTIGSVRLAYGGPNDRNSPDYYAPKLLRALESIPAEKLRRIAYSGGG